MTSRIIQTIKCFQLFVDFSTDSDSPTIEFEISDDPWCQFGCGILKMVGAK